MQKKFLLHDLAPKSAEEEVGQPGARQELSQSTFQAMAHPRTCYPSLTRAGNYSRVSFGVQIIPKLQIPGLHL